MVTTIFVMLANIALLGYIFLSGSQAEFNGVLGMILLGIVYVLIDIRKSIDKLRQ